MYKIYYCPQSCSFSIHALLEELGVAFESVLVNIPKGEHLQSEFKKINPSLKIPVLEHNGVYITESSAILIYLADRHPSELLASADHVDRGIVLSALAFFTTTIYTNFFMKFRPNRFLSVEEPQKIIQKEADQRLVEIFTMIDQKLSSSKFYHDDQMRLCDFALFNCGRWGGLLSKPTEQFTNFHRFMQNMASVASIKKTLEKEGIGLYRDVAPKLS